MKKPFNAYTAYNPNYPDGCSEVDIPGWSDGSDSVPDGGYWIIYNKHISDETRARLMGKLMESAAMHDTKQDKLMRLLDTAFAYYAGGKPSDGQNLLARVAEILVEEHPDCPYAEMAYEIAQEVL